MIAQKRKQILLAGATGLIGKELAITLLKKEYNITILTRSHKAELSGLIEGVTYIQWLGVFTPWLVREVERSFAVINLAGEGIATKLWTRRRRMQLVRSRLGTARALAKACQFAKKKPGVFIQASAIGYYPNSNLEIFNEQSECGRGFLARLTADWEAVAMHEVPEKIRLILLRTGVVLSKHGGMFPQLLLPVKFFVGGWFGSGNQKVSWIHIQDEVEAIVHLLQDEKAKGPFNLVAPEPVSQKLLVKLIAKKTKGLAWLPIPSRLIKLFIGQMADDLLLNGSFVESKKLTETGFQFKYPSIGSALDNLLK